MPYKGTDKKAYAKAAKGKTPEERSELYYKYKSKNQKEAKSTEREKVLRPISNLQGKTFFNTHNSIPPKLKQPSITNNSSPKTNVLLQDNYIIATKSKLKNTNSIIWDKTLSELSDAIKDKVTDFVLEILKERGNNNLKNIIDTYQTLENYIKIAQKIYKVIVEVDKNINKFLIKFQKQPRDEKSQIMFNKDYEKYKPLYIKYKYISNYIDLKGLEVWHLGVNKKQADKLFNLVMKKKKTATSYLFIENENKPKEVYSILTNWDKTKQILIQTTNIEIVPFNKVTKQHAHNEGEGTKTLRNWRKVHKKFFSKELNLKEEEFSEETLIVCEIFKIKKILK